MKKSEIAMIFLIASISILIAYFVAHSIFKGSGSNTQNVSTIQAINSTIEPPNTSIFNSNAINPTVQVDISGDTSAQ